MKCSFIQRAIHAALATAFVAGGAAFAEVHVLNVSLDGAQEVPPSGSGGTGTATVTLDDVTGAVTVSGSYTGLGSNQTAVHIHGPAPVGMNAGVIITLSGTGGTSGTISGGGTLTAGEVTAMLGDMHYINVHSVGFGGGEIRGQILAPTATPALGTWALLGTALLLAGAGATLVARRRMPVAA